jgi:ABC-type transport system involved in cytochrome c biogenesis ATPase subunit
MYVHRIVLRDVRGFDNFDMMLFDKWSEQPLHSVLLTGPNGSGKTTLLRVIAGLWENFSGWLRLQKALNPQQQAQRGLLTGAGLAAIELRDLQPFPIWLFVAATPKDRDALFDLAANSEARFVGEVRGGQGRPQFIPKESVAWLTQMNDDKERLSLGVTETSSLPNLLFLEADGRHLLSPQARGRPDVTSEPLYQWYVTYEARERWEGHIESMLRNLKIRSPNDFKVTVGHISQFLGDGKRITDFDDNLRLRVQVDPKSRRWHYIDDLSAGERQCVILMFMVSRWLMRGGIVLIDEPDLHLHVSLQRQFIHELEKIVLERSGQLIVTSHSPTLWEEYSSRQRFELGQAVYE